MAARIRGIGTAVPETRLAQDDVRALLRAQPGVDRLTQRLIDAAFAASAIDTRYTVLADLAPGAEEDDERMPVRGADGILLAPTTGARNATFVRLAPALFARAAETALLDAGVDRTSVTHVVTVSCTGLFAPGPDYRLVRDLGLSPAVERYHLGFVGCAAAIPALRTAARVCAAQPDAVVLVVCAELCSLHIRSSSDPQQIVAASVFGDGAAAAVVTGADVEVADDRASFEIDRFATRLTTTGEDDMAWISGDHGFEMTLSAEVPRIIGREIREAVSGFVQDDDIDTWAVHPGGRSVLDKVESGLALDSHALDASRAVLRDYGNMSSATVLFILSDLLRSDACGDGERVAAIAFGPGLTVEASLLVKHIPAEA
jgi:predicted naringenin-chalcone synthase